MVQTKLVTLSTRFAACSLRSFSVSKPNALKPILLIKGKNTVLTGFLLEPWGGVGMTQVRIAGVVKKLPARNQTLPDCPCVQSPSKFGLVAAGIESSHCHHLTLQPHTNFRKPHFVLPRGMQRLPFRVDLLLAL